MRYSITPRNLFPQEIIEPNKLARVERKTIIYMYIKNIWSYDD